MSQEIGDRLPLIGAAELLPEGWAARQALIVGALITVAVLGVAALAHGLAMPALALIVAGVLLCVLPFLAAMLAGKALPLAGDICASGLIAAGWLAYTALTKTWSMAAIAVLLVAAAVLLAIYPAIRKSQQRAAERARKAELAATAARQQRRWPDLLSQLGHQDVDFAGQEPTMAGVPGAPATAEVGQGHLSVAGRDDRPARGRGPVAARLAAVRARQPGARGDLARSRAGRAGEDGGTADPRRSAQHHRADSGRPLSRWPGLRGYLARGRHLDRGLARLWQVQSAERAAGPAGALPRCADLRDRPQGRPDGGTLDSGPG